MVKKTAPPSWIRSASPQPLPPRRCQPEVHPPNPAPKAVDVLGQVVEFLVEVLDLALQVVEFVLVTTACSCTLQSWLKMALVSLAAIPIAMAMLALYSAILALM